MTDFIALINDRILEKTHSEITDAERHRIEGLALAREIIAPHMETVTHMLDKPVLKVNGRDPSVGVREIRIDHDHERGTTVNITTEDYIGDRWESDWGWY